MKAIKQLGLDALTGSWWLQSETVTFSDNAECVEPHRANPDGWMVLNTNGRIMFLFGSANCQSPEDEADRASLFKTMVAYTGKVRFDEEGRFVTTVDLAMNPSIRGSVSGPLCKQRSVASFTQREPADERDPP